MAEDPRQVLIHLHSGEENKKPTTEDLKIGEIAVNHHDLSGATLFTKTSDGNIAEFKSQWYVDNAVSGATADLQGKIDALSAGTESEIERVDGRIVNLSASTIAIETVANGALQSISTGTDGTYVTTTVGDEDANHNQTVAVAVKVQAMTTADSASSETMGLAEASDVKAYVDGEIEKAVADVTALSGAVEAFSAEVVTNYATKAEVATASANSITSANTYTDNQIDALDVEGYAQGTVPTASNGIKIYGIKEENGKISHDSTNDVEIAVDGTYDATDNKIATKSTVTNAIAALDETATTVTEANDVITLKTSVVETDGKIAAGEGSIKLAKVAKTGEAEDVGVTATGNLTSTNVQDALEELQGDIDAMATGMLYKGGISDATAITTTTTNKVGDTYTWTPSTSGTVLGKNVEQGDTIIVSAVNASGNATDIVVVERNVDGSVTAANNLTDDKVVLGNGDKTVKESNVTITDLENAIASAKTALQTISSGTSHEYVTVTVSEKANNNQTIGVGLDMQAVANADAENQGLAEASDVKSYVDTLSGNVVNYVNTVSGNIETTINAKDAQNVKSVESSTTQDNYVKVGVDNSDKQNPKLSATVQTAVVDSSMTVTTAGILESDSIKPIQDYVDDKVAQATQDLQDLSASTVALSASTVSIESDLSDLSGVTEDVISDLAKLSGATISEIDVIGNFSGTPNTTIHATVADNKATIDLSLISIDCGEY